MGRFSLQFVCNLEPEEEATGTVQEFMPQARYDNKKCLSLNKYGKGPFCKFKIPAEWNQSGVYAIVVGGAVKYIGECVNLASRYNTGYGNISPRNCFVGGQETNCRVNSLIYNHIRQQEVITLWFLKTEDYKDVERELRSTQKLEWNRI